MAKNWYLTIFEGAEFKNVEKIMKFKFFDGYFLILKWSVKFFVLLPWVALSLTLRVAQVSWIQFFFPMK